MDSRITLHRREFLFAAAGATAATLLPPSGNGWLDIPSARRKFVASRQRPYLTDYAYPRASKGKAVLLWRHMDKPFRQRAPDCCGQAGVMGAQILAAIRGHRAHFSTEYLYAGSRVEIGGGHMRWRPGSTVAWTVEFMQRYGMLPRARYGDLDLRYYRPDLSNYWGRPFIGVPDRLEPLGHVVKTVAMVRSWEQAADSVANGCPVVLAFGSVGLSDQADEQGFLPAIDDPLGHAVVLAAIDRRRGKREGGGLINSWGPNWYHKVEHELGTPAGCCWLDAHVIEEMIQTGEAYAISDMAGFPKREIRYRL